MLVCDGLAVSPIGCKLCAHTMLNFTLNSDRASLSWRSLRRMRDSSNSILFVLGSIVLMLAFCGVIYVFILRRRVQHAPVRVQEIELPSKPTVLLLTADDCDEHTAVVVLLGRFLERHAGVTVLLDYREMENAVAVPSRWLVDSICRASRVLIIVSPCSQFVLNGQNLLQRRPFPDLFGPAMDMIIRECTRNSATNKYIICRLPYSPPTPTQLVLLGFSQVEVPSDLARLTALIHSIDMYELNDASTSSLDELANAVESMKKMMEADSTWINRRLADENTVSDVADDFVEVTEKKTLLKTAEERRQAADQFGLLPPEENEAGTGEPSEFALLPPDSSDDD
ncbi:unnamed protein product [Strongylus vulgaris]|uniref:SEFIR domain-containing protein n=1 Tax=Strongylus vulgaris TaxID=40348 RepID=A0A3P7ILL1_STRVU|nr:unnamed protein product [Strongylus vulgaris]